MKDTELDLSGHILNPTKMIKLTIFLTSKYLVMMPIYMM